MSISSSGYVNGAQDSGYEHGCSDAQISNPSEIYINQPGKGPSHHSAAFMNGYREGFNHCLNSVNENITPNTSIPSIQDEKSSPSDPSTSHLSKLLDKQSVLFGLIALASIIGAILKFRKKNPKERRGFSQFVKENVLRKQDHKCAHCKRLLNVIDYDHKNGDRSDNRESNCQALCPNCHATKTRKGSR